MAAVTASGANRYLEMESDKLVADAAVVKGPYYQDHFHRSKHAIEQAIDGLSKTALIMGAGSGLDLPLKKFAERFDLVVLLDVDTRYTRKTVEALPKELQGKFQIEQADLTGLFEEFVAKTEKIKEEGLSFDLFGSKIVDMLFSLKKKEFAYQNMKASFVCSSLVCSQLVGGIVGYLEEVSQSVYKKTFTAPSGRAKEYDDWLAQLQINHLDELDRLVETEGRVYFADHFSAKGIVYLTSVIEKTKMDLGEAEFPCVKKVQEHIKKRFSTVAENRWGWGIPVLKSSGHATLENNDGTSEIVPVDVLELREYQITSLNLKKNIQ
jgi:NAD(P)-dependent dehydrogenase (short-subunit alcohol dehydrogenase family)